MEHGATDREDTLVFDVTFSGFTEEDYLFLVSMAKDIKARSEAERTLDRIRAAS